MKYIIPIRKIITESYQRKISDEATTRKIFRFFEQVFYELRDKRYDPPHQHQLDQLTPEAREYLLDVLDVLKDYDQRWIRLGRFIHPQTSRTLSTEDELISYLASSFFAGFGRGSILGTSYSPQPGLRLPEPPSQEVVDSIVRFAKSR